MGPYKSSDSGDFGPRNRESTNTVSTIPDNAPNPNAVIESHVQFSGQSSGQSSAQSSVQASPLRIEQGGLHFSDFASYLEIPFVHKRLIVGSVLLGLLIGWLALVLWPRTFESESRMMVRVGRESVSLDPTATTSATLMLQKTQEEEIVSALEVLESRQVAEMVVDKLGADNILNGTLPQEGDAAAPSIVDRIKQFSADTVYTVLKTARLKDDISDRELAVMRVQNSVWNHSPRKSNVLIIEGRSKTPEMAQAIVEEVTESFVDLHLKNASTDGSHTFFEKQANDAEAILNELVDHRSEFMKQRKIVSIGASRELLQQRLIGIDRDLVVAYGELEEAQSSVSDLQQKFDDTEEEIVATKKAGSDSTWSGMRQRVYELELSEQSLAANYTDDHPSLMQIRSQLRGSQDILAQLESERVDEDRTPNPMKAKLLEDLQGQQTRAVGLASLIAEKKRQQSAMQKQTDDLLEHERELTQIDRDVAIAESSVSMLRQKLEEARVIDGLQADKISNVHVFQPATLVERAVSPKKPALAGAFLMLGLVGGMGLAILRQAGSKTLRTSEDVQSQIGSPVIASIPNYRRMDSLRLTEERKYKVNCQSLISEVLLSKRRTGQARGRSQRGRTLGVIAIDSGAGASTLAMNLAKVSATECRLRTVLVDGDARGRSISKSLGINGKPGLVELVNGGVSHDECLQRVADLPMDLISSSADSSDAMLTNCAPQIAQSLQAYLEDCDLLILDLPAANQPDQAIAVAQQLDSVVVVIESEVTQTAAVERLLRRLQESNTEVIGVVLNKTCEYMPAWLRRCVGSPV